MRPASVVLMAILFAEPAWGGDFTAVLSQVEGNVTVKEKVPLARSRSSVRQARFLQTVGAGDEIRVPAGAGARLVCSNDREISLLRATDIRFTKDLCLRNGKPLPPGTYRKLAPVGGRFRSVKGWNVLERNTRGTEDEDFGVPVLLSPRNTGLCDVRPEIVWTPVQGATEYEIELVGPHPFRQRVDASKLSCDRDGWGEAGVCVLPWPEKAQELPAGEPVFLRVGARRGLASPLRTEEEPSRIQRLAGEQVEEVLLSLEKLEELPVECAARRLLEAGVYAQAGLFSEAVAAYRKALSRQEAPEGRITLGDVYLAIGLQVRADQSYREALAGSPEPAVRAAAEFGLGKIEYARGSYGRALEHFRTARDLYAKLRLPEESSAARAGMDKARKKVEGNEAP